MLPIVEALLTFLRRFVRREADWRLIPWGEHVTQTFRDRVAWTADALGVDVAWLMAVIAFETGRTFRPDIKNAAGSGAVGLIQFMPSTAAALGTSAQALASMSAEDQLRYVHKYLQPYAGRIQSLADLYMAILWPAAIGKPSDYVLFDARRQPKAYSQNAGLDEDKSSTVTKDEAVARVQRELDRGIRPGNVWRGEVRTKS